jgi:putative ABC transport system substrate-binding protein
MRRRDLIATLGTAPAMWPLAAPARRSAAVQPVGYLEVPAIHYDSEHAESGGLLAYGPRGEKPPDLPIEQPTRFTLAVNLKAAKALGLALPPTVLVRADQTIE